MNDICKILFLGDLFYDEESVCSDIEQIGKWIKRNNYHTVINLEGAICLESVTTKIKKRGPNLTNSASIEPVLNILNVVGLCLANNHIMDYGEKGLDETIHRIEQSGIRHTGAGTNIYRAQEPFVLQCQTEEIVILNFGWEKEETIAASKNNAGCSSIITNRIIEQIKKYKTESSYVVCFMHWGYEYNRLPMPRDIELAHQIIDNGCDLIIGSHPHVVQPYEVYKGKRIYYSLGNFYFGRLRETYRIKFNETINNQCDYGIGVVFDILNKTFEDVMIAYDQERKESRILKPNSEVLKNITGIEYKSHKYYKACKQQKKKNNPILIGSHLIDSVKANSYNAIRNIKSLL